MLEEAAVHLARASAFMAMYRALAINTVALALCRLFARLRRGEGASARRASEAQQREMVGIIFVLGASYYRASERSIWRFGGSSARKAVAGVARAMSLEASSPMSVRGWLPARRSASIASARSFRGGVAAVLRRLSLINSLAALKLTRGVINLTRRRRHQAAACGGA